MLANMEDRLVVGDETVLRELFQEYGPLVLNVSRALVGADADDVVQQVFVAVWNGRRNFDPSRGSLAAWLTGIARFKSIDHLRSQNRLPSTPTDDIGLLDPVDSTDNEVVDRIVLAAALASLPSARREVVELGFFKQLTQVEIAERLDLPLGTVKSHMRRGLEALQRELEDSRDR